MYDRLIDNYTERATKNMGRKQREDTRKELKSHIMDSAAAIAANQNKPVDEAVIREAIAKMGPPEEFTSSYTAELNTHILDSAEAIATERNMPVDGSIVREAIQKMRRQDEATAYTLRKKEGLSWGALIFWAAITILTITTIIAAIKAAITFGSIRG